MHGFLLVDKPVDWTSHDVVAYLRGALRIKKIGHAGTLDPFTTGLLIVGVGREATKRLDEFKGMEKEYIATIELGVSSDTYDATGAITENPQGNTQPHPSTEQIHNVLHQFIGMQEQIPPMFSAKKLHGKKLYELARKGLEVERQPNEIEVFSIELLSYSYPHLEIKITCSTGTYIRSLAHDIGTKIGTGGLCKELRRTKIGTYSVKHATGPKNISQANCEQHFIRTT